MTTKLIKIHTLDYQDWADSIDPTANEEIHASKAVDNMIWIQVKVKDFKKYLDKVKYNLAGTRAHMQLKYGYYFW